MGMGIRCLPYLSWSGFEKMLTTLASQNVTSRGCGIWFGYSAHASHSLNVFLQTSLRKTYLVFKSWKCDATLSFLQLSYRKRGRRTRWRSNFSAMWRCDSTLHHSTRLLNLFLKTSRIQMMDRSWEIC